MCANPFLILTYIYIQYPYTQHWHTTSSVSITMSHTSNQSLIWAFGVLNQTTPKWSEQFLYLTSGQEVGLYLFPFPALFLQQLGYLRLFILTQWGHCGHCCIVLPLCQNNAHKTMQSHSVFVDLLPRLLIKDQWRMVEMDKVLCGWSQLRVQAPLTRGREWVCLNWNGLLLVHNSLVTSQQPQLYSFKCVVWGTLLSIVSTSH